MYSAAKMLNICALHKKVVYNVFCAPIFNIYFSESDCLLFSNPNLYLFLQLERRVYFTPLPFFRKTGRKREGPSPPPTPTSSSSPPPSPPSVRRRGSLAAPPPSRAVLPPPYPQSGPARHKLSSGMNALASLSEIIWGVAQIRGGLSQRPAKAILTFDTMSQSFFEEH